MLKHPFFSSLIVIVIALMTCSFVTAITFAPQYYWSYQSIKSASEQVIVTDDLSQEIFTAQIEVNSSIHNVSNWVTFIFQPSDLPYEKIEDYNVSILLYDYGANSQSAIMPNYTVRAEYDNYYETFIYNVSLGNSTNWQEINLNANYTLLGSTQRLRYGVYSYHHKNNINIDSIDVAYSFPFQSNFILYPSGEQLDNGYKYHTLSYQEKGSSYTNIEFEDTAQQESKNVWFTILTGIGFTLFGAILGLIPWLYDHFHVQNSSSTKNRSKKSELEKPSLIDRHNFWVAILAGLSVGLFLWCLNIFSFIFSDKIALMSFQLFIMGAALLIVMIFYIRKYVRR